MDIDLVSTPTLWKIYNLIIIHAPEVERDVRAAMNERDNPPRVSAKPAPKKKNKPMSKNEQERNIQHLKNSVQAFERQGSGSQEPVIPSEQPHHPMIVSSEANNHPAVEQEDESSGDDESDSEEE